MQTKELLINKLTEKERFCLIAYLQTGNQMMAYVCSRKRPTAANTEALKSMASRWINSEPVKAFLEIEQAKKAILTAETANRNKEDTIRELNRLADQTSDTKLKAEILQKLSDLEGWKKEQKQTEDDTIRYYLPLTCNRCELYITAKQARSRPHE